MTLSFCILHFSLPPPIYRLSSSIIPSAFPCCASRYLRHMPPPCYSAYTDLLITSPTARRHPALDAGSSQIKRLRALYPGQTGSPIKVGDDEKGGIFPHFLTVPLPFLLPIVLGCLQSSNGPRDLKFLVFPSPILDPLPAANSLHCPVSRQA